MKNIGKVIVDWRNGYVGTEMVREFHQDVYFATPHSMMEEPRFAEVMNMKIAFISEKLAFKSEEEANALMEKITADPANLDIEFEKTKRTEKENNYFIYRDLIAKAYQSSGISTMKYIYKSLLYTDEPIDALLWIVNNLSETSEEAFELLWKAYATSEMLAEEYDKSDNRELDKRWTDSRYRPYMRAKACYINYQLEGLLEEEKEEELEFTQKLQDMIQLDTDDPMGLRFIIMGRLIRTKQYDQMEALYQQFPDDKMNPLFLYPMAFMKYATLGKDHPDTNSFIQRAIESNLFIAVKPNKDDSLAHTISFYKPHSEEEAQYFFRVNPTLFDVDQEQLMWLFATLQKFMQNFADQYLGDQA
jgi:hypothetical protein